MVRFLTGDELGSVKSVRYDSSDRSVHVDTLRDGGDNKQRAIQHLAVRSIHGSNETKTLVATVHADGSAGLYNLAENTLNILHEWNEPRLKERQKYVGLHVGGIGVFSCTSNGALRLMQTEGTDEPSSQTGVLPMRLTSWSLSSDEKTFAYAGEEVELSVWDVEKALSQVQRPSAPTAKKRKRGDDLFPGEMWRAKNLPNDFLGLRQPVRNTCLSYLPPPTQHSLVVGTYAGDVRKYDTRAQRRPVASWEKIGKISGITTLTPGQHEHELFVADGGCNLFCVDARNGKIVYGYQGIAGSINAASSSPGILVSASRDRYVRVHSCSPLAEPGKLRHEKGKIIEKTYFQSIPTAVVWDQDVAGPTESTDGGIDVAEGSNDDGDDVWAGMQEVDDDEYGHEAGKRRKSGKKASLETA
ncbi:WD40-repeat-containing domain protein [Vararia minispora EC-137]|uniref:WD40-repeat-containing domain protein n=1 Tax=Vararia minispora EC-137 TaxID=1314806 RepID=A0ACB8QHG0_9AGAM|nr:WD40-repeat-containing domain protein [Vararia minispora EC-137]